MRFLRRIEGVTLFNKVPSSEIQKSSNIEALFLRIKLIQIRWFYGLRKDSRNKVYLPKQLGKDQFDYRELDGLITLRMLDGIIAYNFDHPDKMMELVFDCIVSQLNLKLLPQQSSRKKEQGRTKKGKKIIHYFRSQIRVIGKSHQF